MREIESVVIDCRSETPTTQILMIKGKEIEVVHQYKYLHTIETTPLTGQQTPNLSSGREVNNCIA